MHRRFVGCQAVKSNQDLCLDWCNNENSQRVQKKDRA